MDRYIERQIDRQIYRYIDEPDEGIGEGVHGSVERDVLEHFDPTITQIKMCKTLNAQCTCKPLQYIVYVYILQYIIVYSIKYIYILFLLYCIV